MSSLDLSDHRRDSAGLTYVYPVISRRSGGLSIGINLNPNNACNWRCVYCQVPNLRRGNAPPIDLAVLDHELETLLDDVLHGGFYERYAVPLEHRVIRDIALSGNGEPTSSKQFGEVVALIAELGKRLALPETIRHVLISNGSLMRRAHVQRGLALWDTLGGEVWFKLDSATADGIARINGIHLAPETAMANLESAASRCATWIQTCLFAFDGDPPAESETSAYMNWVSEALRRGIPLRGVLLYGLARPSMQAEAARLSSLPREWLEAFAERLRATGLTVRLHP